MIFLIDNIDFLIMLSFFRQNGADPIINKFGPHILTFYTFVIISIADI
jgi:hypothetical protein